jgi:hypothetical protein
MKLETPKPFFLILKIRAPRRKVQNQIQAVSTMPSPKPPANPSIATNAGPVIRHHFLSAFKSALEPALRVAEEKANMSDETKSKIAVMREKVAADREDRFSEVATGVADNDAGTRTTLTENDLRTYFYGHEGQAKLQAVLEGMKRFARAQAPREEIVATIAVLHTDWPDGLADRIYEFGADTILRARLAARAEVRVAIYEAAFDPAVKPGQIALLKAFAHEHLDWAREPIDAQIKNALKVADEKLAKEGG